MDLVLLLVIGISIVGLINNSDDENNKSIKKEKRNHKLFYTDSIEPYIDYSEYRVLQNLLNTNNYITPNDILYLDIVGLDTYTATVLLKTQRKIRSLL